MSELNIFNYQDTEVRTVSIDGEPWFVAADVARILGYRDAHALTRRVDEDDKGTRNLRTPGGDQQMTVISEAGLYVGVLGSTVPRARDFKRWVTREVLPQIRKTGSYAAAPASPQLSKFDEHERQMRIMQMAKGIIDPGHLEAKARIVLAKALGEAPEIPAQSRPLYAEDYLYEKGLDRATVKSIRSTFGRRVSAAYKSEHGEAANYADAEVAGRVRKIKAYTEADRALFDQVWSEHYADVFAPKLEVLA